MSLRVKKYFIVTSLLSPRITSFDSCSNGSMMLRPIERSRPAPRWPASMMPVDAPVTTYQPCSTIDLPSSLGLLVLGRVARRAGRAEDRYLSVRPVGSEDRERFAQLAQRLTENFQIVLRRALDRELIGHLPQSPNEIGDFLPAVRAVGIRNRAASVFDHDATPSCGC